MKKTPAKTRASSADSGVKESVSGLAAPSAIGLPKRRQPEWGGGLPLSGSGASIQREKPVARAVSAKAKPSRSAKKAATAAAIRGAQPSAHSGLADSLGAWSSTAKIGAAKSSSQEPAAILAALIAPEIESCVKAGVARSLSSPVYSLEATQTASRGISAKKSSSAVGALAQLPTRSTRADNAIEIRKDNAPASALAFGDLPKSATCVMNPALIKPAGLPHGLNEQCARFALAQSQAFGGAQNAEPAPRAIPQEKAVPMTPEQKAEFEAAWRDINVSGAPPSAWSGWKMAQFLSRVGQLPTHEQSPFDAIEEPPQENAAPSAYWRQMQRHWVVSWLMDAPSDEREKLVSLAFGDAGEEAWQAAAKTQGGKTALKNTREQHEQLFDGEPAPEDGELLSRLRAGIVMAGEESTAWGRKLAFLAAGLSLEKQASIRAQEKEWFEGDWQDKMEAALREAGAPEAALQRSHGRLKHVMGGWATLCEKRVKTAFLAAFGTRGFFSRSVAVEWASAKMTQLAGRPNPQAKIRAEKAGQPLRAMNWPDDSLSAQARVELARRAPWIAAQGAALGLLPPALKSPLRQQWKVPGDDPILAPLAHAWRHAESLSAAAVGAQKPQAPRSAWAQPDPLKPHTFPRPLAEQHPGWIALKASPASDAYGMDEAMADNDADAGWNLGHGMPLRQRT